MSYNILITGAGGSIAQSLALVLKKQGHRLRFLSRSVSKHYLGKVYQWDIKKKYIDPNAFQDIQVVIHLAGAGIFRKAWSEKYKREIIQSRAEALNLIKVKIMNMGIRLDHLISASAVGYYKPSFQPLDEQAIKSSTFLGKCSNLWEDEAHAFNAVSEKVSIIRNGVVLCGGYGVLTSLKKQIWHRLVLLPGGGKQIVPWIHMQDIVGIYQYVLNHKLTGIFNAVAPCTDSFKTLIDAIYQQLQKKSFLNLPIPAWLIRLVLGQRSCMVLDSFPIVSSKIQDAGYNFKFSELQSALKDLLIKAK